MEGQVELPFPTMTMEKKRYKIFGIVTNRDIEGSELVDWLHKRCGKSEEAHAIMKEDLAGGKLPSADFGENAAWWWIMILAFNLNAAMKQLALGESWATKRMKALRFSLISLPGRVIDHARELVIRLVKGHPSLEVLLDARQQDHGARSPAVRITLWERASRQRLHDRSTLKERCTQNRPRKRLRACLHRQ